MTENAKSLRRKESTSGKGVAEGKDDLLEGLLDHLENIVRRCGRDLNATKKEVEGGILGTQRDLTEDLSRVVCEIKAKVGRKNEELRDAQVKLQELQDMVKRKEPKVRAKNLESELIQADKMVTVGQLAGGVAHELNNPLTGVLGNAQVLLSEIPKHNPWYQDVYRIYQSAKRCKEIVTNLLTFSRQQEFQFELLNINEVIENTLNLCEHELAVENIEVVKEFEKDLPKIRVSLLQMEQVFLNLIINARQAMPQGGKLTITTRLVERRGVPEVEVVFADTGRGIKKEDLSKMFKPFFTTKEKGKGTGLGLSVSKSIVEKHNGTIKARSEGEGRGANFTIFLPCGKDN